MRKFFVVAGVALGLASVPFAAHAENVGAVYVQLNGQTVINEFPEGPVLPIAPDISIRIPGNAATVARIRLFNPSPCGQPC